MSVYEMTVDKMSVSLKCYHAKWGKFYVSLKVTFIVLGFVINFLMPVDKMSVEKMTVDAIRIAQKVFCQKFWNIYVSIR